MRRILLFLAIVGLIAILIYYYSIKTFKGDNNIKFLSNSALKSFDDICRLKELHNKIVYIDVWGTLCGPCIKEFKYVPKLHQRFQNEPVEFLYLGSPYNFSDDEFKWKKMIKEQQLFGYHVFLTNELYESLWDKLKDSISTKYQIPHYIILNKAGKIVNANALRPSAQDRLYDQITSVLSTN